MNKVLFGDCRDSMRKLIADGVKVQMCVTSPPYFGLRDYGVDGQLGLEETPEQYITNMVEVFRLVRNLLSDDGTCWINIGDSYASSPTGADSKKSKLEGGKQTQHEGGKRPNKIIGGLKPKDLIGIPWMLAFALRADGWYLRQDIIWHKPNPMPESVTDRCTKSHEYIFLMSKSERYYFDNEAIKEPLTRPEEALRKTPAKFGGADKHIEAGKQSRLHSGNEYIGTNDGKRNKRSVWEVATQPYSGAHFATFPPALIEPCILAGSRPGDIVLDPFFGSGTTGQVSQSLGRQWIGCELNPLYAELQNDRTAQLGMALA